MQLSITNEIRKRASQIALSPEERSRFSRHLLLPEVGEEGQKALKAARVLVIGAGGLGSPVSLYLAAAGVGTIGLVDFDKVDATNLQRQILFSEEDTGHSKAQRGAQRLRSLNSYVKVRVFEERLDADNVENIFRDFDVIVDGTDNFSTRYLVNDAAVLFKKPVAYGSIFRFDGQASMICSEVGPCYRCLFPSPPPPEHVPNCAEGGVLGVLPGMIGVIQATETIKVITGIGEPLIGRLLTYDAAAMRYSEFAFRKDPQCAVCGKQPTITTLNESAQTCGVLGGQGVDVQTEQEISPLAFEKLKEDGKEVLLLDVRTEQERTICKIPGSMHIPLNMLDGALSTIPKDALIICHCKSGLRSLKAASLLRAHGFDDVRSLKGGIIAWIDDTKAGLPKY